MIETVDDLVAALPGQKLASLKDYTATNSGAALHSFSAWSTGGLPGIASTPPTGTGEIPGRTTSGALPFNAPAGANVLHLAHLAIALPADNPGSHLVLYDRLWHNSGLDATLTTSQTVNSTALTRSTSGEGVEIWAEIYTATGATTRTLTVTYTNSDNAGSRSGSLAFTGSGTPGRFYRCDLQSGDWGAKSIQSCQLNASTGTAGNFGLVLLKPIAVVPILYLARGGRLGPLELLLPQIDDDACLTYMVQTMATATIRATAVEVGVVEG